jgi:uncharacterized protein YndB with AHSA1/START domain
MRKLTVLALIVVAVGLLLFIPVGVGEARRIETTTIINRPPAEVFGYVTTPANWPKWHPASLSVSGAADHSLTVGEQVREEFLVAGHHGHVLWTVLARDAPRRWVIEGKVEGGGGGLITYTLDPQGTGAQFHREFVYRVSTLFGFILDRLFVYDRITAESTQALKQLKAALEAS